MKDPGIRWVVAGALGVAVAALAALWGHSFAIEQQPETGPGGNPGAAPKATPTGSGNVHNKISDGTFHGPVIQGRDFSGPISVGTPSQNPDPKTQD